MEGNKSMRARNIKRDDLTDVKAMINSIYSKSSKITNLSDLDDESVVINVKDYLVSENDNITILVMLDKKGKIYRTASEIFISMFEWIMNLKGVEDWDSVPIVVCKKKSKNGKSYIAADIED